MSEGRGQRSGEPDVHKVMKVVLCVVAVIVIVGIGQVVLSKPGSPGQAKYDASVDMSKAVVVNPKTLRVYGTVKNTGDGAGSPSCSLTAYGNAGGDFYGTEGIVERRSPLAPGGVWSFNTDLGLTRKGARITDVYVQCG